MTWKKSSDSEVGAMQWVREFIDQISDQSTLTGRLVFNNQDVTSIAEKTMSILEHIGEDILGCRSLSSISRQGILRSFLFAA